ncbi:DUF4296 domain-containing protein [Algoriphagus sediminis]|uniref:DUF4296 domain-containing protein n=1 Tax=Algoriphagus sediminis TaxID=3057113 RepID=A0ABT7Y9G9_9BACT|nr:DUF4296 domain-containing protein [Algoriphagus sediminis]MDN3203158.1 DUF4296 domain-containing protein [Algoriphagus sediminis]
MKNLKLFILFTILLTGCSDQEKPEFILNEDEMVNVLIDIHIAEGISSSLPVSYDSSGVMYTLLEKDVFTKHEITDSVFTQSMLYYLQYPAEIDEIYGRVVDSLSKKQALYKSQQENQ